MNDFQTRLHEAFQQAQTKAAARAKDFEKEARKVLETLGDRAQAELKTLLQNAQSSSREQMHVLGVELEKLGKKLQDIAARSAVKAEANGAAKPDDTPSPN